ncbi:MAG: bile acid:sodium symporter [Akkermansia sp.]|nr:bile acid:sodium symporter [Akkermansia sp.]
MGVLRHIPVRPDRFTSGIIISVVLGVLLPCSGWVGNAFGLLTDAAIFLLFFLYGAKLSRASVLEGLLNWRLQSMVFFFTFVFFPLLIPLLRPLCEPIIGQALYLGLLYVACLPSTVQSSIAFTSVAAGNVPAAVCSASVSSLLGVFLTPMLVSLLFSTDASAGADIGLGTIANISLQILLPFFLGQWSQRWLRHWVHRHKDLIRWNDQGTIWLVVYTSFSGATAQGYWSQLSVTHLAGLVFVCLVLLSIVHASTYFSSKWLGFSREDCITIVFCGSKKSLAVGAPMMMAIFGEESNHLLLPLMIFHQVQLMTCAHLAKLWKPSSHP